MNCPGPGEVLQFANEVKNRNRWRRKAQRTNGILDALAWVLGGQKKPPFLGKPTPRFPPDIETIAKVAEQAKVAVRNHPNLSY